ncbi:MAG TPA: trypsin-like peptidase domain-containing protein [Bryobacteraceae bacterium]|nr:trypsin-like peptidase domain-containing protein [Bryobacteraceae bacterium]
MRTLRPFLGAAVLVAGFLYVTSGGHWDAVLRPVHNVERLWNEPAVAASGTGFTADEQNNIDIYRTASAATVNITSRAFREDWFFQVYPVEGAGSGFILNSDGEILTNNHVVNGASQLSVTLADKKTFKARILLTDRHDDLALIKIEAGRKLPALRLGDSDGLVVGQKVLAIGNPFGQFAGTLTTGIVSSLGRTIQTEDGHQLEGMIQTDAAINPGNSGGPLLDSHGNVIGINTAIYTATDGQQGNIGLGFATPINRVKSMLEEFQQSGHISRLAPLGIQTIFISGDLADALHLPTEGGLLVIRVDPGSAAEEFGIRGPRRTVLVGNYPLPIGGDFITAIEGRQVDGNESLTRALSRKRPGDLLELTLYRNGQSERVRIKLSEAPQVL